MRKVQPTALEFEGAVLFRSAVSLVTVFMGGSLALPIEAQTQEDGELKSFYIATHVVSDASPFRYEYVLEVKPQGEDTAVRIVRIAPSASGCGGLTVKAFDHLIANTTPGKIARLDLCSLSVGAIELAIKKAQPQDISVIDDTASHSIVAMCGKTEKVFELPYPETVDLEKMKKTDPRTASLWDIYHKIYVQAFGKTFSFYDASASQDEAFQALGAQIVPAIREGLYHRGFANGSHLEALLSEYTGPGRETNPWTVEFLGQVPAELSEPELPKYPPLARQTRIMGDVHLSLALEPQTGLIKDIQIVSGHPLLANAAKDSVSKWRFREGASGKDHVEIGFRFIYRCP